jgi:hypothetical protein
MDKKATRINRAIRCMPGNKWFDTEMIDKHAFICARASQSSAIISEMWRNDLLLRADHPTNTRAGLYRKTKAANAWLDNRLAKAKPAKTEELIREFKANIDILESKSND